MYRQASLLVLAAAAGVLIGALGTSVSSDPAAVHASTPEITQLSPGEPDSEDLAIESLAKVLNAEINERRVLTEQIEQLRAELLDLQQNLKARVEEAFQSTDASGGEASGNTVAQTREERLVAAGFSRQQLEAVERLQAETEMAQIELDDRARREGWINTPRYFQESRDLATGATVIRNALGDELYDHYLFASGFPNRVAVGSVIETSPARDAGFQGGDVVIRYGGEDVYSAQQLVDLRSSGARGEPVTVEILRNGESLRLTIPRGPMGISVAPILVDPATHQR
jgi:PDZ domain